MTYIADVIVLGLGAMGAATTFQLAKRGARVVGIDRFEPPHTFGSTHGESRITRIASGEGAIYSRFAKRSHEIWREIEVELQLGFGKLLTQNGVLVIAGPRSTASHDTADFLPSTIIAAKEASISYELLEGRQIRARFPTFAVQDDET